MTRLVVGGELLLVLGHHHGPAFGAHQHLVLGGLELGHGHHAVARPRRQQCGFIDEVGEIGAGKAGRASRNDLCIHIGRHGHFAHMHLENLFAAQDVRVGHHHLTVEPAGAQQRRVEDVGTVGRGDQDHAFIALESVHLDQQLVEGLLPLVVAAAETGAAMAADRVQFVDEDDARRVLLALLEHVADPARADADEHLDEVGNRKW